MKVTKSEAQKIDFSIKRNFDYIASTAPAYSPNQNEIVK